MHASDLLLLYWLVFLTWGSARPLTLDFLLWWCSSFPPPGSAFALKVTPPPPCFAWNCRPSTLLTPVLSPKPTSFPSPWPCKCVCGCVLFLSFAPDWIPPCSLPLSRSPGSLTTKFPLLFEGVMRVKVGSGSFWGFVRLWEASAAVVIWQNL